MKKIVAGLLAVFTLWSGCGMCFARIETDAPGIEDSQSTTKLSAQKVEADVTESTQPNAKETETLEILETQKPLKAAGGSTLEKLGFAVQGLGLVGFITSLGSAWGAIVAAGVGCTSVAPLIVEVGGVVTCVIGIAAAVCTLAEMSMLLCS